MITMRPMAPSTSEFRQLPSRREPTDMEKTMRIAHKKRAMAKDRLANKQPVPTFAPDSSERINKMQIARLQGFGNTYPAASTVDKNPPAMTLLSALLMENLWKLGHAQNPHLNTKQTTLH